MKVNFKTLATLALIAIVLHYSLVSSQQSSTGWVTGSGSPVGSCSNGVVYVDFTGGVIWVCAGGSYVNPAANVVPSGATVMITSGSCPSAYSQVAALDASVPEGTLAAHGDVGTTGGANTITPTVATLTAAAQLFSGSAGTVPAEPFTGASDTTSSVGAGTPSGTVSAPTITWPVGVPTNSAISMSGNTATESAHTHSVTAAGTNAATTTSGNTAATNIAAGTGSLTAAKATAPNLTVPAEVFTGSAVTSGAGSAHSHGAGTLAASTPTISWPAGVPTNSTPSFSGSPLAGHTHTVTPTGTNGTVSFTPAGTNSTSTVTGTLNSFDNRQAFVKVIYCQKT